MIKDWRWRDFSGLPDRPNIIKKVLIRGKQDFPEGVAAKTLCSQCRGTGFDLGQGTRFHKPKLRVCMLKDSACHSEDQRSPVLQSRFSAAK